MGIKAWNKIVLKFPLKKKEFNKRLQEFTAQSYSGPTVADLVSRHPSQLLLTFLLYCALVEGSEVPSKAD